jgi:cytochrome c oxidase subunit 2
VRLASLLLLPALAVCGCEPVSSALDPGGIQAERIEGIWWLTFWLSLVVYAVVLGWLAHALLHRGRRVPVSPVPAVHPEAGRERRAARMLALWIGGTMLILLVLIGGSYVTDARLVNLDRSGALTIQVTAQQWWWQVRYVDPD